MIVHVLKSMNSVDNFFLKVLVLHFKEFYANLFFSQNSRILKSFTPSKENTLDDATLGKILNIPQEG